MDVTAVSVVVATKDRSALLREALASIRRLEGPDLTIDLIVVDNGSTDDTRDVAEEFQARYFLEQTPGAAAARNEGLRRVEGEFVAFLDDDDVWTEEHLRPHIALMRQHPELGAVIGRVVNADPTLESLHLPWPQSVPSTGNLLASFYTYHPQIGATVVRASVARSIEPLDRGLVSSEEWDWHLRLAMATKIGFVPVTCLLFRQRPYGTDDATQWIRVGLFDRVLLRNARRTLFKVSPLAILRCYWQNHGRFAFSFTQSIKAHVESGDVEAARRALRYSARTSIVHTAKLALTDASIRGAVLASLRRSQPALA